MFLGDGEVRSRLFPGFQTTVQFNAASSLDTTVRPCLARTLELETSIEGHRNWLATWFDSSNKFRRTVLLFSQVQVSLTHSAFIQTHHCKDHFTKMFFYDDLFVQYSLSVMKEKQIDVNTWFKHPFHKFEYLMTRDQRFCGGATVWLKKTKKQMVCAAMESRRYFLSMYNWISSLVEIMGA